MQDELFTLAESVGQKLMDRDMRLVVAESCTGGWLSKVITDVPGSSKWFEGGLVAYSNHCKQQLGVSEKLLEEHGAVSEAVVKVMARGALTQFQSHLSIAVSGVAGPAGGTQNKPVGAVWFAWASVVPDTVRVLCEQFQGDRELIRLLSVESALKGVLSLLGDMPGVEL